MGVDGSGPRLHGNERPREPLTPEQQQLVLDFDRWLPGLVAEVPEWLRIRLGRDVVEQDIRLAVVKAAHDYDPVAYPGVPFAAFAFNGVRLAMRGFGHQLGKPQAWQTMPAADDGAGIDGEIPDHREPCPDRLLRAWCDEDYARQRECLSWRERVLLYLRTVEGLTLEETGECMGGVTRERVRQLEERACRQLAAFRVRQANNTGGRG